MPGAEIPAALRAARRAPLIPVLVMLLPVLDALYLRLPIPSADRILTIVERHPNAAGWR